MRMRGGAFGQINDVTGFWKVLVIPVLRFVLRLHQDVQLQA
jgi:hypothetical protein